MFANGIKVITRNYWYVIIGDSLLEPAKVPVFYKDSKREGFTVMDRDEIFADIVDGANVTTAKGVVVSEDIVSSAIEKAVHDVLPLLKAMSYKVRKDALHTIVLDVLHRTANILDTSFNKELITLRINDGIYHVQRQIVSTLVVTLL